MPSDTSVRIAAELDGSPASWACLSGYDRVTYATQYPVPIEAGPSPFAGGPDLALVDSEGRTALVVPNLDADRARESAADAVFDYVGFDIARTDVHAGYLEAVGAALGWLAPHGAAAVEPTLPDGVARLVGRHTDRMVDARTLLDRAQMIKTGRELSLLRRSGRCAALAQRTAVTAATDGMAELELFAAIRAAVEVPVGERVAFTGDLVSGVDRTAAAAGWPTARRLQPGDPVIADLAPRVAGYWADSCNTFTIGAASTGLRRLHEAVRGALAAAVAFAGPGVPTGRIDAEVRRLLARDDLGYSHHTGHSIGTSVHEWPRIIPDELEPLHVGMVILLEPGAYLPGVGGVRLERMYVVTEQGLETLTDFPQQLESG